MRMSGACLVDERASRLFIYIATENKHTSHDEMLFHSLPMCVCVWYTKIQTQLPARQEARREDRQKENARSKNKKSNVKSVATRSCRLIHWVKGMPQAEAGKEGEWKGGGRLSTVRPATTTCSAHRLTEWLIK